MEFKININPVHPEPDFPEDEDLDPVTKAQKLLAEWENEEPVTLTHKLIKALSASKISVNQGAQNAGKVMTVGLDGIVAPEEAGGDIVVARLSKEHGEWILDKSFDELYEAQLSFVVDLSHNVVLVPREVNDSQIIYYAIVLSSVTGSTMIDSLELEVTWEDEVSFYEKIVYGSNTPLDVETWTFELASGQTVTKNIVIGS